MCNSESELSGTENTSEFSKTWHEDKTQTWYLILGHTPQRSATQLFHQISSQDSSENTKALPQAAGILTPNVCLCLHELTWRTEGALRVLSEERKGDSMVCKMT